jgi:hypothetical protein
MKKIRSILLTLGLVGCNLITSKALAQDNPGFPGNGTDAGTPVSPIDNWIIPMFLIGVGLTFIIYIRKLKLESK